MAAASGYLRQADPRGAALAGWWVRQTSGAMERIPYLPMFLYGLLLGDPRVEPTPPRKLKLPLTHVMRGLNYVFMRSDYWDRPDATVVAFGNGRYRYRAMPANCFALYSRGAPLFLCRAHTVFHGYTPPGVVSSNVAVLYKADRLVPDGLFLPPETYAKSDFEKVMQVESVPGEYDYMVGHRGRYWGTRVLGHIKTKTRTLVYLRPKGSGPGEYVVLLDRVETTDTQIVPHAVFNVVFEPRVGTDWTAPAKARLVHPGQWETDSAACVMVTMDHDFKLKGKVVLKARGRAFLKTLYPKAIRTLKIGGPKHFMDDITGKGSLTHSPCQGFYKWDRARQIEEGGYWRFHVIPKAHATSHAILNVIEPASSARGKPSGPLELLEGSSVLGVQAGANVVLFSRQGQPLERGTVRVVAGTNRLIVADLFPGARYALTAGGRSLRPTASALGTIFAADLKLSKGNEIRFVRAGEAPSPPGSRGKRPWRLQPAQPSRRRTAPHGRQRENFLKSPFRGPPLPR